MQGNARPIRTDEPTGVLHPRNLTRFGARWFDPAPGLSAVVDQYWTVHWDLEPGEVLEQSIVDLPAITLSLESGDVPARLAITGVHRAAWHRSIRGSGEVFGIRLRPAGLAVLSTLGPHDLLDATAPVTDHIDAGLHRVMSQIAHEPTPADRCRVTDAVVTDLMTRRPPSSSGLLANDVLDELRARVYRPASAPLSAHFGLSPRTIQRALAATLGIGPKQVARRLRLQEVARAIVMPTGDDLAQIAIRLGYSDQAHLTTDFRMATGLTPGAYRSQLRNLGDLGSG